MRCYFHLTKGEETMNDDRGLEVADLAQAYAQALEAVAQMHLEQPHLKHEFAGWTLTAVDDSGVVLFTVPLDLRSSG